MPDPESLRSIARRLVDDYRANFPFRVVHGLPVPQSQPDDFVECRSRQGAEAFYIRLNQYDRAFLRGLKVRP